MRLVPSICVVDEETCASNVRSALARGLPVCRRSPRRTGRLAIVGSGPSVLDYIEELRTWPGEIWAINGAYDFLRGEGIVPHGFVGMDPVPGLAEYVAKTHKDTTYFISSVCDPAVFDALKDQHVWLWHSKWDAMPYPADQCIVSGGTTCITRAPFLGNLLGWRDMVIFGADSSYTDTPYCYRHGTFKEDTTRPRMKVRVNGQVFETELALTKQAAQLSAMNEILHDQLTFRCGGLLQALLSAPMHNLSDFEKVDDDGTAGPKPPPLSQRVTGHGRDIHPR